MAYLGDVLISVSEQAVKQHITYRELDGPAGGYNYLLSAPSYRTLEQVIVTGAARRSGQPVARIGELHGYYTNAPTEQYLMQTGRVYFRGMAYSDLHRLQFDLETTSLSHDVGRIFLVAVRDSLGFEQVLEAPTAGDERQLIAELIAVIRDRDPDVIENHNLFGFDLPFLESRSKRLGVPLLLGRPEGPALLESYAEQGWHHRRGRTRFSAPGCELVDTITGTLAIQSLQSKWVCECTSWTLASA